MRLVIEYVGTGPLSSLLAVSDYSEWLVKHIFGDSIRDGLADELLNLFRMSPDGRTLRKF